MMGVKTPAKPHTAKFNIIKIEDDVLSMMATELSMGTLMGAPEFFVKIE